ncbi:MAG: DUF2085 domain-containing protein [Chloroflexota bacterium]
MAKTTFKRIASYARYLIIPAALIVITIWLFNTPPDLLGKADGIGYAVCHRISERSFHIGDRQLPLCARCSGMYLGAMAGLVFQIIVGRKRQNFPPWSVGVPLILFLFAFAIDGANSYVYLVKTVVPGALANIPNLYVPNNVLRIITGSGMGLGLAALIYPAFNQTAWVQAEEKPALNWKGLLILVAIIVVIDLLTLTESPIVLYPAAFISAGGVIALLTMVYTIVWMMLTGQENKFTRLPQMWLPLLAGMTIAFIQILAVDLLRLWLTGTWGAFPLN